jgi:hypothetical protein
VDAPPVQDAPAGRRVNRAPAAWGAAIAAAVAATIAGKDQVVAQVAAHGVFLFAMAAAAEAIVPGLLRRRTVLPLALLYAVTFSIDRRALTHLDYVFNADCARYLYEAASGRIQARHLGIPVVTFAPAAVGRWLGVPGLGREVGIAETAAAGALTVAACGELVARLGPRRWPVAGVTALLAGSLAIWSLSSMIETFAWSALMLVLTLHALASWIELPDPRRAATIGLLVLAALGFSLENAYLIAIVAAGAAAARPRGIGRVLRDGTIAIAIPALGLAAWIPLAARAQGPEFFATWGDQKFARPAEGLVENLGHFTAEYLDLGRLARPSAHLETAWRVGVMSVRGQPGEAPERYPLFVSRALAVRPGNLAYVALVLALAALALPGLVRLARDGPAAGGGLVAAAGAVLAVRHLFTVAYAPTQSLLFSPPSLVAAAFLLGAGLLLEPGKSSSRDRTARAAMALLVALVVGTNAFYLVEIQTRPDAPWLESPAAPVPASASVSPTAIK